MYKLLFLCLTNIIFSGVNCTNSLAGPLNGRVEVENSQYEGIASYVCNSGYELSGSAVRQCQRDGRWSGAPPQCTGKFLIKSWLELYTSHLALSMHSS